MVTRNSRIKNLNWNLLRTFVVITQEKSISRAADKLLLRQPTVTAALQRLEETLGCQLIERDARHFRLTSYGEQLRQECIELMRSIERIDRLLIREETGLTGLVKIPLITHLPLAAFDRAIRQMRSLHPSVKIEIIVACSQKIVRSIAKKQYPFGFCLMQKPVALLECQFLYRARWGIYCGINHHLYGYNCADISELRDEAFVAFACDYDDGTLEPMVALREGVGLASSVVAMSYNLEEVRRLIAAGIGIGVLPRSVVHDDEIKGKLWLISSMDDSLGADVYFVQNIEMKLNPAEEEFLDILKFCLSNEKQEEDEWKAFN